MSHLYSACAGWVLIILRPSPAERDAKSLITRFKIKNGSNREIMIAGRRLLADDPYGFKKVETKDGQAPGEKKDPSATDMKLLGMIIAPIVIICVAYFGWEKLKSIFSKCGKKEEHEATN